MIPGERKSVKETLKEIQEKQKKESQVKWERPQTNTEYMYSATFLKEDLDFNQGTFYNRLEETGIRNSETKEYNSEYAIKNHATGKIMFNQKAYELLIPYKISSKDNVNDVNSDVREEQSYNINNVIDLQAHNEIINLLKQQIEDYRKQIEVKDTQIEKFQKQQENFQILQSQKNTLGTAEDNKKWYRFWK